MRFRVKGLDRESGRPCKPMVFDVPDERAALQAAVSAGMLVEKVEPLPPAPRQEAAPDSLVHRSVTQAATKQKYSGLLMASACYRVLAFIWGVTAAVGAAAAFTEIHTQGPGFLFGAALVVYGVLSGLTLLALADGIRLMLNIETTLRQIRDRLPNPVAPTSKE